MERRIFLLLSLLFLTMGIYAQETDEIHLKEGCLSFFQQEALAFVQVDLSGTEYGKENLYEEYRQTDVEEFQEVVRSLPVRLLCPVQLSEQRTLTGQQQKDRCRLTAGDTSASTKHWQRRRRVEY